MATSAFKSASRRSNSSSSSSSFSGTKARPISATKNLNSSNKPPPRRSRSVSAVPRSHHDTSSSDFLIKRDNPLFWSNVSPPDKDNQETFPACPKSSDADNRRGRSVYRNTDSQNNVSGNRKEIGRSLSKVDARRSRSVSRGPLARTHPLNSESDVVGVSLLTKYRNGSDSDRGSSVGRKSNSVRSSNGTLEQVGSLPVPPRDSSINLSFQEYDLRDDASSCIYETVRSEVRRAIADIQNDLESAIRNNATAIASINATDFPSDLDIRREYASKLEQSQERARKLRADLAVEEHRSLELNRILMEVLPAHKNLNMQKTRAGRKSSIERRKMAKRLTEEAIAYFDECVSLSTFDSDFSSQDDPPISLVSNSVPVDDCGSLSEASTRVAADHCLNIYPNDKQEWGSTCCHATSGICVTWSSKQQTPDEISVNNIGTRQDGRFQFSFAQKESKELEIQHQIGKYVKNFERDVEKVNVNSQSLRLNPRDLDEYNFQASVSPHSFLFDTLAFKNQIESGAILLCGGGGVAISLSPFAFVI